MRLDPQGFLTGHSSFKEWAQLHHRCSSGIFNTSTKTTVSFMESEGFTNIEIRPVRLTISTEKEDQHLKTLGSMHRLKMLEELRERENEDWLAEADISWEGLEKMKMLARQELQGYVNREVWLPMCVRVVQLNNLLTPTLGMLSMGKSQRQPEQGLRAPKEAWRLFS